MASNYCKVCNRECDPIYKHQPRVTCSKKCLTEYKRRLATKIKTTRIQKCPICQNKFVVTPAWKKNKFCSKDCHSQFNSNIASQQHREGKHLNSAIILKGFNKGHHYDEIKCKRILEEANKLKEQGYLVIPITKVIPDIIAIKDNKICAIEVEYAKPKYNKYIDNDNLKHYDKIIWIIKGKYIKEFNGTRGI